MNIAIALATFRPNLSYLEKQLDSLQAQSETNWSCAVSDESGTGPQYSEIQRLVAGVNRTSITQNKRGPKGVVYNFANAIGVLPKDCDYYAFCDQDDIWLPEKLAKSIQALTTNPSHLLVHSDLTLIDGEGKVLAPSCWDYEKRDFTQSGSLLNLVLRNRVTGCTTLFRRELLKYALPIPQGLSGEYLHDHWFACLAHVFGGIVDLKKPLVLYRQHGGNVIGANHGSPKTRMLRKVKNIPAIGEKSKWALASRQRLATDLIERVEKFDPRKAHAIKEELAPLLNLRFSYCLKQLAASKLHWPEAGLWIQLSLASLRGKNSSGGKT